MRQVAGLYAFLLIISELPWEAIHQVWTRVRKRKESRRQCRTVVICQSYHICNFCAETLAPSTRAFYLLERIISSLIRIAFRTLVRAMIGFGIDAKRWLNEKKKHISSGGELDKLLQEFLFLGWACWWRQICLTLLASSRECCPYSLYTRSLLFSEDAWIKKYPAFILNKEGRSAKPRKTTIIGRTKPHVFWNVSSGGEKSLTKLLLEFLFLGWACW